ncbi:MAG: glutamate--tRNA ligase [Patescibacteria group bacterium]
MQENTDKKVIVRFPPSPTGNLHIGTARTLLFNFLFSRKHSGKIVMRSEDTDKERSKPEFEENILDGLKWLGLSFDEFSRQSERAEIHKSYLKKMVESGTAYVSKEPSKNNPDVEVEVIRLKNPGKVVTFNDVVRGDITFDTTELSDFVIAKNFDEPLYHLAVVVDDFEMGVTHVIRGEDHISNTPRQILIQEAIGAPRPVYAHIPLILGADRSKLSKRHGATSLVEYRNQGYLPEALINYLALLGWNPGTDKELFTMDELMTEFSLEKVQTGGAIFDQVKLDWINKEHMKNLPKETVIKEIMARLNKSPILAQNSKTSDPDFINKISNIITQHISKWGDIDTMVEAGDLSFFFNSPSYSKELLSWKGAPLEESEAHLQWVADALEKAGEDKYSNPEEIKSLIFDYATEKGKGNVLWPLRVALSGREKSPDPFSLIYVLGKEEAIERTKAAVWKIKNA